MESNEEPPDCPSCGGRLRYRDKVKRKVLREGRAVSWFRLSRYRCSECHAMHRQLPDCIVAYKQYDTETVSGVLSGIVSEEDLDSEDYPCTGTMARWRVWLQINTALCEAALRRYLAYFILLNSPETESLLSVLQEKRTDWMEHLLRLLYNGRFRRRKRRPDDHAPTLIRIPDISPL